MIDVPYAMGLIGTRAPHTGELTVTPDEIAAAAVGVGVHPAWNPSPLRAANAFDARWRVALIHAVLDWSTGSVAKRPMYDAELDKTEKGFASYHIGMTFSLLWARKVLDAPDLAHVDRVLESVGIHSNDRRPDLVGASTTGDLYAIEAKGRSGGIGDSLVRGKRQINEARYWFEMGGSEAIGVVTAAYFDGGTLRMRAEDPESWARTYELDQTTLKLLALEPFAEAIAREPERVSNRLPDGYVGAEIGDTGVLIGLAPRVADALALAETRQPPTKRTPLVPPAERRATPALQSDGDADDVKPREIPGAARYRRLAAELDLEASVVVPLESGDYVGRVSSSGVAVMVDRRWRPSNE